uniref:G domain-containing protein n=1 Tax=Globodera pallida TaxID=36090 RepID=A0A183CM80_GLOPA
MLLKRHGHLLGQFVVGQNGSAGGWPKHLRFFCSRHSTNSSGGARTAGGAAAAAPVDASDSTSTRPQRALRVAVIGAPNVGKSALTNALMRTSVCANTTASLTEDMCQLVVVDSPGLISTGHGRKMAGVTSDEPILAGPTRAIERAELILVVHDVTMPGKYLNHRLLYFLHRFAHIPSCLVLNKVDLVSDRAELFQLAHILTEATVGGEPFKTERVKLGKIDSIIARQRNSASPAASSNKTGDDHPHDDDQQAAETAGMSIHPQRPGRDDEWHRLYTQLMRKPAHKGSWSLTRKLFGDQFGWPNFGAMFYASALRGDGIDALRHHLRSLAQSVNGWRFMPQALSTTDPRILCAEHTRSALLDRCPGYIAYALRTRLTEWETSEQGVLRIAVDVFCDKERWVHIVGCCTNEIEQEQCERLAQLFRMPVQFRMFVCGPDRKRRAVDGQPNDAGRDDGGGAQLAPKYDAETTYEQLVLDGVAGGGASANGAVSGGGDNKRQNHQNRQRRRRGGGGL